MKKNHFQNAGFCSLPRCISQIKTWKLQFQDLPALKTTNATKKKRDHPKTLYKLNQFSFEAFAEHLLVYKQSKQQ